MSTPRCRRGDVGMGRLVQRPMEGEHVMGAGSGWAGQGQGVDVGGYAHTMRRLKFSVSAAGTGMFAARGWGQRATGRWTG